MSGKARDKITITAQERRLQALELRKQGKSYRAIGAALGVDHKTALTDVRTALQRLLEQERESVDELRTIELERLDALLDALWVNATNERFRGQTRAVEMALKVMERRAKLLGLDAPTRQDIKQDGAQRIVVTYDTDSDTDTSAETP